MRLSLALVPLLLFGATAHSDDELDIPGLDATDLRGDAMMWEDANVYLEPWEGGVSFKVGGYLNGGRKQAVGWAMPIRIVDSTLRNFVEIEAPNRADCTYRRLDVDNRIEGLRMYVRREDLAPVLTKPYSQQFSDGTRVKLGIGVPVIPTASGDYWVAVRDDKVRLSIPHGSVGYLYKPGKVVDPELPKDKVARLDRGAMVKLGDDGFQVRTNNWLARMPEKRTDTALFTLSARCLEVVVEAPATNVRPAEAPRITPVPAPVMPKIEGWRIRAGTPLVTVSNREVAVAAKDIPVTMAAAAPELVCFDARVSMIRDDPGYGNGYYGSSPRTFKLCAPGSAVEK
jgi:hypothetical protein